MWIASIVAIASAALGQTVERIPSFGLLDSCGLPYFYSVASFSAERMELLRSAGDTTAPGPGICELPARCLALDLRTGARHRIDLAQSGAPPLAGAAPATTFAIAVAGNHRFAILRSSATNLVPGGTPAGLRDFWLDRDTDQNGVFDEIGGRRLYDLGPVPEPVMTWAGMVVSTRSLSENGRYAVGLSRLQLPLALGQIDGSTATRIELIDLDADGDGTLAETAPGSVALLPLTAPDTAAPFTRLAHRPTISGDGRFVAWEEFDDCKAYAAQGLVTLTYPSGWPAVRHVLLFDRDADRDGVFDEVGATERHAVTASGGPLGAYDDPRSRVAREGGQVLYLRALASGGDHPAERLDAYDPRTRHSNALVPTALGQPFASSANGVPLTEFRTDAGARRVWFTALDLAGGAAARRVVTEIDRDADGNGIFDDPNGVAYHLLTGPDGEELICRDVPVAGPALFASVAGADLAFAYENQSQPALLLLECGAALRIEPNGCAGTQAWLYLTGCPDPGRPILVAVESHFAAAPFLLLAAPAADLATWGAGCPAFGLLGPAVALPLLAQPVEGTASLATLAAVMPAHFTGASFALQAASVDAAGQPILTRRLRVDVP